MRRMTLLVWYLFTDELLPFPFVILSDIFNKDFHKIFPLLNSYNIQNTPLRLDK